MVSLIERTNNKVSFLLEKRWVRFEKEFRSTLKNTNAEHLHDLRVATRRLLALLDACRIARKSRDINQLIEDLKRLMKPLGKRRDFLLQVDKLKQNDAFKNAGLAGFYENLNLRLKKQEKKVETVLNIFDIKGFSKRLEAQVTSSFAVKVAGDIDVWSVYRFREFKRIIKWKKDVFHKLDLDKFHKMRIRLKNLRYFLEIVQDIDPCLSPELMDTLANLQTLMGDIHDIDILAHDLLQFRQSIYPSREGLVVIAQYVENLQETRWSIFERVRMEFEMFEKLGKIEL